MLFRLKIIWFALTAPYKALVERTEQIEFEIEQRFIQQTQKRLDSINRHSWKLVGVRVEHTGNLDVTPIQDFLTDAPCIIQRLINTVTPSDEDMQRWADDVVNGWE